MQNNNKNKNYLKNNKILKYNKYYVVTKTSREKKRMRKR